MTQSISEGIKKRQAEKLYSQFVKPLEDEYRNQYAAVSSQGRLIIDADLIKAIKRATVKFPKDIPFVFKIGQKVIGKWR